MDFMEGETIEKVWDKLNFTERENVINQVACFMLYMRSIPVRQIPGCQTCYRCECEGHWFKPGGTQAFDTMERMEDWMNQALDALRLMNTASRCIQPFQFEKLVVTHQNLTPSNLLVGERGRVSLIDWRLSGVYPDGMEAAAMKVNRAAAVPKFQRFYDRVLEKAPLDEDACAQLMAFHAAWKSQEGFQLP